MKIDPLPAPKTRSRQYPSKVNLFLTEIKYHFLPEGGQQFLVPDKDSIVQFVFKEFLRNSRNYRAIEIFHSVQVTWLSQKFGQHLNVQEVFAKIALLVFPSEYGFDVPPSLKYCGTCQKLKEIDDFEYSYQSKDRKKRQCKLCVSTLKLQKRQENQTDPSFSSETLEEKRQKLLNQLLSPVNPETLDTEIEIDHERLQ